VEVFAPMLLKRSNNFQNFFLHVAYNILHVCQVMKNQPMTLRMNVTDGTKLQAA